MTNAAENIQVELEFTPNPDTLKYVTSVTLLPAGVANFTSAEDAKEGSVLASKLFDLKDVVGVMIGKNFVTLTLKDQNAMAEINDKVIETIKEVIASGEKIANVQKEKPRENLNEIEKKIVEILDNEIRPAVAMDGGDISFEKYEDGFVYLKMQGACSGCPSSMMTLKMGVENRLKDAIPEIEEVIPV